MTTTPPISNLQYHLGYWLRIVSNAVSQSFARKVESEGVTVAEWVFLRVLYDEDGMAPQLVAESMGMTKGAISKLADRLIEKDLIGRETNPDDRRGQKLTLKPAARVLVPRLCELADRNDAEFFDRIPAEQRHDLENILRKIATEHDLTTQPTN